MKVIILASGSKGNATYIETSRTKILIDAGLSYRQIKLRLANRGIEFNRLDAILITHEHIDHTRHLASLLEKTGAKLYIAKSLQESGKESAESLFYRNHISQSRCPIPNQRFDVCTDCFVARCAQYFRVFVEKRNFQFGIYHRYGPSARKVRCDFAADSDACHRIEPRCGNAFDQLANLGFEAKDSFERRPFVEPDVQRNPKPL